VVKISPAEDLFTHSCDVITITVYTYFLKQGLIKMIMDNKLLSQIFNMILD